jgi:hypothetical protein
LSDNFHIHIGLKQGEASLPRLLNFILQYANRKVQKNQVGLKLNGTHQLLAYGDDEDMLGNNIDTVKKRTETLSDASKEVDLEVNAEKTKYMFLSLHQNAGQNRGIQIANSLFENESQFKYLGMTVTNQNLMQKDIKRLHSDNACYKYHSVQNPLSACLLFRT